MGLEMMFPEGEVYGVGRYQYINRFFHGYKFALAFDPSKAPFNSSAALIAIPQLL